MSDNWEQVFSCVRCGNPVAVRVVKGSGKLIAVGKCSKGHKKRIILMQSGIDDWASILKTHFFKCVKCDSKVTYSSTYKGVWAKVNLICPMHGPNEQRLLPISVFNAITQESKPKSVGAVKPAITASPAKPVITASPAKPVITASTAKAGPNCQYCDDPTSFIPQYSRYYCYKCQRYVEDQKVVEKLRYKPEIPDLRQKLKLLSNFERFEKDELK